MSQSPKPPESRDDEQRALQQLEALPDAIVAWDREGTLLSLNAAARTLFDVPASDSWEGMSAQQFLQHATWCDEQHRPFFFAPWLLHLASRDAAAARSSEHTLVLGLPSHRKVFLEVRGSQVLDVEQQVIGILSVFHEVAPRYQKALHIQRVYEALVTLNEAVARIPGQVSLEASGESPLFSPPVLLVSQQLVDVIRQVLDCWRVSLIAFRSQALRLSYGVGSGFTAEQEQQRRDLSERFSLSDVVDNRVIARLQANQEVILSTDHIRIPTGYPADLGTANFLAIPLFLEQNLAGILIIHKHGWESEYSQEEIELVKAVAAHALLLIDCLGSLHKPMGQQVRELVLPEVDRLSNDFLTLASHELRTPLTGIKGHLQLAQRRFERFKGYLDSQPEHTREHLEQSRQSLEAAEQGVRRQERMVQDVIDGLSLQADQLDLVLSPCDLLVLLKQAVAKQQQVAPDHAIELDILTAEPTIPVLADAGRIIQVLTIYLANACEASPMEHSVTIQVKEEDALVRISVHDEGPGIFLEKQDHLWDRFSWRKGSTVRQEWDMRFGFSFSLCQALIDRHHGKVGLQSAPGQGTTFWLTLPTARPPER
jgi:signal transduction histidine kinase